MDPHKVNKVSPPPAMLINTDITHIYETDLRLKMFNFELLCLSAPPHSKEDWKNGLSETVRHQIFSSMSFNFFRLWRLSDYILPIIVTVFTSIYFLTGIYVTYVNPQYEQYGVCWNKSMIDLFVWSPLGKNYKWQWFLFFLCA